MLAVGSAHPASANSLVAQTGRGGGGELARASTRLASSRPRPAGQRRKGRSHVIPLRRHRRRPSPGCRGADLCACSDFLHTQARLSVERGLTWRRVPGGANSCGTLGAWEGRTLETFSSRQRCSNERGLGKGNLLSDLR